MIYGKVVVAAFFSISKGRMAGDELHHKAHSLSL
jgi:hypothetical protein